MKSSPLRMTLFTALALFTLGIALFLGIKFGRMSVPADLPPASAPATLAPTTTTKVPASGVHYAAGPKNGGEVALAGLREYAATGRSGVNRAFDFSSPHTFLPPMPVYDLVVNTPPFSQGGGLECAVDTGSLEYLMLDSAGTVASAYVAINPASGEASFRSFSGGTGAFNTFPKLLPQIAALDPVRAGSFEVRLLTIKSRYTNPSPTEPTGLATFLYAIWLKSDSSKSADDFLYLAQNWQSNQLSPPANRGSLQSGKLYSPNEMLDVLRRSVR